MQTDTGNLFPGDPAPTSGFDKKGTVILQTPNSESHDVRVGCSKLCFQASHGNEEGTFHSFL